MADAMNLDPTDLGIEEFETLETIQAELERLDEERNHEGKVIIQPARNRVVMASELPQVKIEHEESTSDGMKEEEEEEVGSLVIEKMEEVYVEGDEEVGHPDDSMIMMMEDQTSNEPIQAGERRFAVFASSHQDYNSEDTSDNHGHSIFSETVVGEEIIEDEQVIKEEDIFSGSEPRIYDDVDSMGHEEEVVGPGDMVLEEESCRDVVKEELEESLTKEDYDDPLSMVNDHMEEVTSDNVLAEETVIGDVEDEEVILGMTDGDEPILTTEMVVTSPPPPPVQKLQQPILATKQQMATTLVLKTESLGGGPPTGAIQQPPHQQQITVVATPQTHSGVGGSKLGPSGQPPPGVYVVATTSTAAGNNLIGAQSLLQASAILSQKDTGKVTRMIVSSGGGGEMATAPQTIRIIGSQGKLLGSPAKTITLAQAKQMGLITSTNQHILPAAHGTKSGAVGKVLVGGAKKTVTVMKSPTKILPAPPPSLQQQQQQQSAQAIGKTQKVLIRQANTLKAGTILTPAGGGQPFIRIPPNQTLGTASNIHQIHIPGKQVQYVKLVGAGTGGATVVAASPGGGKVAGTVTNAAAAGSTTLVPVSALSKSIPVALPTSVLNSTQAQSPVGQQTFKVVPIQQQQNTAQGGIITTSTHRVLIPASAVKAAAASVGGATLVTGTASGGGGASVVNHASVGGQQQTAGVATSPAAPPGNSVVTTVSNIVMLPSHLIHQVKKVPLLGVLQDNKMTVTSAAGLLGTAAVNGSGARRSSPATSVVVASSTPAAAITSQSPVTLAKIVTSSNTSSPSLKLKEGAMQQVIVGAAGSGTIIVSSSSPSVTVTTTPHTPSPSPSISSSSPTTPTTTTASSTSSPPSAVVTAPPQQQHQPAVASILGSGGNSGGGSSLLKDHHHHLHVKSENCWSGDENTIISTLEANGIRPRKPCNCTKSMCLKLYCDCFANGEFCHQCNCTCCYNNLEHEEERQRAIKSCLERNPTAFRPKIGKSFIGSDERRHNKGCNCRRSGCLKNYCECYEAKIPCSKNCKCVGCKNLEGYPGRRGGGMSMEPMDDKTGLGIGTPGGGGPGSGGGHGVGSGGGGPGSAGHHLALGTPGGATSGGPGGGLHRSKMMANNHYYSPQHPGRTHNDSFFGQSSRQAFNLLTSEVVQATCQCMLAQAEDWEKNHRSLDDDKSSDAAQSLIIEEFGKCVIQIIDCVTKSSQANHHQVSSSGGAQSASSHHHHNHHNHHHHNHHHTTTMS